MTRGILSGLFTPDQARNHLQIIKDYLLFPDGVRLMDRPAQYRGGEQKYFVRAETAANFGREIGLLYVHATIRFAEAMARLGQADLAFWALEVVNPVGLSQVVPMAVPRQANAYFSSSDGGFSNRETAAKRFGELREGKVAVKGGWRVYSSGPGIYLKTWSCDLLGLRFHFDELVIDPVLPRKLDGLEWHCTWAGKQGSVCFSVGPRGYGVVKILVNGMIQTPNRTIENPYRDGGVAFDRKLFLGQLGPGVNQIEIELR